jgi:DNA polymerase-3 subunit delta'
MRQAMLMNFNANELVYAKIHVEGFDLKKFAPFVHENNIVAITQELEEAIFHVERNGNAKIIFTDLSIKLTRLLHTKAA